MFDAGLSMENMVLAAESMGLGTMFIGGMDAKKAEAILGVPQGFACVIFMVLGYPDNRGYIPPSPTLEPSSRW